MRRIVFTLLILTAASLTTATAQEETPPDSTGTAPLGVSLWPPEITTLGMVWTPQVRVNRRIGVGLGAETLIAYRTAAQASDVPPSTIKLDFLGTTRNQWRVNASNDVFWRDGRNHARVRIDHDNLARRYWGRGPDSDGSDPEVYRPQSTLLYGEALLGLTEDLRIGPRLELQHQAVHDVEGGAGQSDSIRGTRAGLVTGAGLVFAYDTRDCQLRACRGIHVQGMALAFLDGVSDQRFQVLNLDLRAYLPLARGSTLAVQGFYYGTTDDPPFWRLASLGGRDHSRAYSRDRWLDEHMAAFQVEWRRRVKGRFGVVAFAGAALVNHALNEVHAEHLKPSVGVGLRRYPRGDGPPVPVRLDVAVGHRHARVILAVGEAF